MTITKRLHYILVIILIAIILQAIIGIVIINGIYDTLQKASGVNHYAHIVYSQKAEHLLIYFKLLIFAGCSFVVYATVLLILYVTKRVTPNISKLIEATEKVTAGKLDERVKIEDSPELSRLADSFNAMMTTLELSQVQMQQLNNAQYERFIQTITAFVKTIEAKDIYTRGHSENVAYYSTKICEALDWLEEDIENIKVAALLHDIGKIGIREEVLNKPTKLSDEEFLHIKSHPQISRDILGSIPNIGNLVNVAVHHHERYDGRGYPDGLKGESIPYGARILAVADAFDAMTSARPYKLPMDIERAIAELEKNKGTQFDPELVPVFVELVRSGEVIVEEARRVS